MQKVALFSSIVICFVVGFKIGRRPKKVSNVSLWDRALSRDEIETLYKAEKIKEESYSKKV